MAAKGRVTAEDATDGDEEANAEVQELLPFEACRQCVARDLRQAVRRKVSPGQAGCANFRKPAKRLRDSVGSAMQNGLYVAVSAQVALQRRLETIANNIANMNTVGYRATGVSFEAEMAKAGETTLHFVSSGSDYLSQRPGGLIKTDNPLDFAIQGQGWFGIETPSGIAYTRDGRARIDESGTLRTLTGDSILDAGGAPLLVDSGPAR
jgi:hypothetical protein